MVEKEAKSQKQTEKFDIREIYTPLSVACPHTKICFMFML